MTIERTNFGDRLIAVEPLSPVTRQMLQQELHTMFVRELTTPRRIVFGIVGVSALIGGGICGLLALTEPNLPLVPRIALSTGALFGLAWAIVALRIVRRGVLDLKWDNRRIAAMVWFFTVLLMVFFLIVGMSSKDRLLGLTTMVTGLAFLIGAAVYWLSYRIEAAELNMREKFLQLELRLAEYCERK